MVQPVGNWLVAKLTKRKKKQAAEPRSLEDVSPNRLQAASEKAASDGSRRGNEGRA
jgi:hypothetical protein